MKLIKKIAKLFSRPKELTLTELSTLLTNKIEFSLGKENLELKGNFVALDMSYRDFKSLRTKKKEKKVFQNAVESLMKKLSPPEKFDYSNLQKFIEKEVEIIEKFEKKTKKYAKKLEEETKTVLRDVDNIKDVLSKMKGVILAKNLKTIQDVHKRIVKINKALMQPSSIKAVKDLSAAKYKLIDKEDKLNKDIEKLKNKSGLRKKAKKIISQLDKVTQEIIKVSQKEEKIVKSYLRKEISILQRDLKKLGLNVKIIR